MECRFVINGKVFISSAFSTRTTWLLTFNFVSSSQNLQDMEFARRSYIAAISNRWLSRKNKNQASRQSEESYA